MHLPPTRPPLLDLAGALTPRYAVLMMLGGGCCRPVGLFVRFFVLASLAGGLLAKGLGLIG